MKNLAFKSLAGISLLAGGIILSSPMTQATRECSPEQQTQLKQSDDMIAKNRGKIVAWYARLCKAANDTRNPGEQDVACEPLTDAIFSTYESGNTERYCAPRDRRDHHAVTFLTARLHPATSFYPTAFKDFLVEGDVCSLVGTNFHERLHAVYDLSTFKSNHSNDAVDGPYLAGDAAELACIDSMFGSTADSENGEPKDPYLEAQKIFFARRR